MNHHRIVVIDYGLGNLFSVRKAIEHCGANNVVISDSIDEVIHADKIVLPGVGAFKDGMAGLVSKSLVEPIISFAKEGKPILGICLGMQLLATCSDEFGHHKGLDLIPGGVVPIPTETASGNTRKIPSIGWSTLRLHKSSMRRDNLLARVDEHDAFYFVHSFYFKPEDDDHVLASYDYDEFPVTAAVSSNNIVGYQFHPEKSGPSGLRLLENFLAI